MSSEKVREFAFREYEAGPRRDVARSFAEFAIDLNSWLVDGQEKEETMNLLLQAREAALRAAESMLR